MARIRASLSGSGGGDTAKVSYDLSYSTKAYNTVIPCGFKPKKIMCRTSAGTGRFITYDEDDSTTQIRQNGTYYNIGNENIWTLKSIDDVGSANNPTGGFTLGKYSTVNWADFTYIAIG